MELNKEQTKAIRSSKKRNRAQSVKSKKRKSKIRDIDVCKDKVKNSIFRREKGHKESFQDDVQRKHSKSVTSHSFDHSLLKSERKENVDELNAINHWIIKGGKEKKDDDSMTHSVTTTFRKIEEKLKDGLIEPGSTQYFEELDNAMTKLKEKHQKLANKSAKRQRSVCQKKVKRPVVRSQSVYKQNDDDDGDEEYCKRSKHKKSKTVDQNLSARKRSKHKKISERSKSKKHKHSLKKQEKEILGLSSLHKSKSLHRTVKKSQNERGKMSNYRRQKSAKVVGSKSKKKKRIKKKREYVMDSEDEEDIDLDDEHKRNQMNQKRKRIKLQNEQNKKENPFMLNSSRREGQQFKYDKHKKNGRFLCGLYDEQRMELI